MLEFVDWCPVSYSYPPIEIKKTWTLSSDSRYLLKCIQDWFQHHGDELYEQLKHVRNQLTTIENLLKQNTQSTQDNQHAHLTRLAETHQILKHKGANKISKKDSQQLDLF